MKQETNIVDIEDLPERINSRQDFQAFMRRLVEDFRKGEEWENAELGEYLRAIEVYTGSIDGYYKNFGKSVDLEKPTWRVFADILLGARVYE